jgi:hypothetical protein
MNKSLLQKATAILTAGATMIAPLALSARTIAASLTDVTVSLSNEATSATGDMTITFTPNTAITNGTVIEVTYDNLFTGGAAITDADVSVTGTNISSSVESDFSDGYFRSVLTTTGSVTTAVTIVIGGVNQLSNPASSGNYNVSVIADIGGLGAYDFGAGLAYVADDNDVTVSAVVPPVIDLELYQTGTDTELTDPNSCNLGVLSLSQVKDCNYDVGFATNNTAGLTVMVTSDGTLNDGLGNDIDAIADGTVTAGSEEYGFTISDIGAGCSASAQANYGTQDEPVPTAATNFISSTDVCNGTTAGQAAKRAEVTHKASMDTDTIVGSYDQVVTYTAYTN